MANKRWNGNTERRERERREGWDTNKCLFCEDIQNSTAEHRELVCKKIAAGDKANLEKLSDMRKIFGFCALVALGFAGWIAIDHIGLANKVVANTEIIKYTVENQKTMNQNISQIMWKMNLQPEALPSKPEKVK